MATNYNNLWKKLIDKGMSKTDLRMAAGMSSGTLARLSKCEPVETTTLEKICKVLECDIGDIVSYVPDGLENAHDARLASPQA
ncbi:MAG: helix-turn-helix transcriptional regulator [Kiritimatiellae bacterium]|nr:helix-turn-helix transcriptional regulator [Kiritimatiellia bacterium]